MWVVVLVQIGDSVRLLLSFLPSHPMGLRTMTRPLSGSSPMSRSSCGRRNRLINGLLYLSRGSHILEGECDARPHIGNASLDFFLIVRQYGRNDIKVRAPELSCVAFHFQYFHPLSLNRSLGPRRCPSSGVGFLSWRGENVVSMVSGYLG